VRHKLEATPHKPGYSVAKLVEPRQEELLKGAQSLCMRRVAILYNARHCPQAITHCRHSLLYSNCMWILLDSCVKSSFYPDLKRLVFWSLE
jgi:hypothetical protein